MSRTYKFLQPSYFDNFRCTGGDCSLNCCDYNWRIDVDRDTYIKYKKVKTKPLSTLLSKHIKKNNQSKSDLTFATLQVDKINAFLEYKWFNPEKKEDENYIGIFSLSKCPFQTEDKLCILHRDLGYDFLSNTCKVFPRVCNKYLNNYEMGLSSGCEEVSKLLFNEKEGIKFEFVEKENPVKNTSNNQFKKTEHLMLFDTIRAMCIGILQTNSYSIENRMILLTAFMYQISDFYEKFDEKAIYSYIETFSNNLSEYEKLFEIDKCRHDVFLNLFIKELSSIGNYNGDFNLIKDLQILVQKLKNCYTKEEKTKLITLQIKDGPKYDFEEIPEIKRNPLKVYENGNVVSSSYLKLKKNTEKLMKNHQYYIENLLVNAFFTNRYPINSKTIKDSCIKFVITYCFYKGLLISAFGDKKELDEYLLHRVCTIWGRRWADQLMNLESLSEKLKKENFDTLSNLIVFIKSC